MLYRIVELSLLLEFYSAFYRLFPRKTVAASCVTLSPTKLRLFLSVEQLHIEVDRAGKAHKPFSTPLWQHRRCSVTGVFMIEENGAVKCHDPTGSRRFAKKFPLNYGFSR